MNYQFNKYKDLFLPLEDVRKCPNCGRAEHLCICDDEDYNDEFFEDEDDEYYGDDVDAFGRNYSDADPGL